MHSLCSIRVGCTARGLPIIWLPYVGRQLYDAQRRIGTRQQPCALTVRVGRQHLPLQIPVQLSATYLLKTSTAELARQHIDIFAEVDETRDVARTRTVSSDFPRLCAENSYFTQSTHTPIPVPCHHLSANMTLQQASVEQEWYRVFKPELDTAAPDPIDPVNGIMKEFSLKRTQSLGKENFIARYWRRHCSQWYEI